MHTCYFAPRITRERSRLPISRSDLKNGARDVTFVMDAVTVCATRAYSPLFLSPFLLFPFFSSLKTPHEKPTEEQSFSRSILEEAVNVGAYASSDSRCDHRGSRFMIIKAASAVSLVRSQRPPADSFLKTNFDFPIRGQDLRPPVLPGHLFCALSRIPSLAARSRDLFFPPAPRRRCTLFYCPLVPSHEQEDGLTASLSWRKMDFRT